MGPEPISGVLLAGSPTTPGSYFASSFPEHVGTWSEGTFRQKTANQGCRQMQCAEDMNMPKEGWDSAYQPWSQVSSLVYVVAKGC